MSYRHREKRDDFSGGYNSRDPESMLKESESGSMMNIAVGKRGAISPRPGTLRYNNQPVSDPLEVNAEHPPVTSIYEYINQGGLAHFMAFAGESLKVANDADGWDLIQDDFTVHSMLEFITHPINDIALFVNGADGYWETNGVTAEEVVPYQTTYEGVVNTNGTAVVWVSGDKFDVAWSGGLLMIDDVARAIDEIVDDENITIVDDVGVQTGVEYSYITEESIEIGGSVLPSRPRFIEYHAYRVWLANVEGFQDRIYFNVDDINGNTMYNYFTSWSWLRAGNVKGEHITGIKSFRGALYVFTPTSIKAITGDDISNYAILDISNTVGSIAQRTIQVVGGNLFFTGIDGAYIFDGTSTPFKVSQRIDPTFEGLIRHRQSQSCGGVYENKYIVSMPISHGGD